MHKHSCEFCTECRINKDPPRAHCNCFNRPLPEEMDFHGITIENGCGLHSFRETSALTGDKYREPQTKDKYFEFL